MLLERGWYWAVGRKSPCVTRFSGRGWLSQLPWSSLSLCYSDTLFLAPTGGESVAFQFGSPRCYPCYFTAYGDPWQLQKLRRKHVVGCLIGGLSRKGQKESWGNWSVGRMSAGSWSRKENGRRKQGGIKIGMEGIQLIRMFGSGRF